MMEDIWNLPLDHVRNDALDLRAPPLTSYAKQNNEDYNGFSGDSLLQQFGPYATSDQPVTNRKVSTSLSLSPTSFPSTPAFPSIQQKPPSNAYNLFFQHQQQVIEGFTESVAGGGRKHSHGKLPFRHLARHISTQWKETSPKDKAYFQRLLEEDKQLYDRKLQDLLQQQLQHQQQPRSTTVTGSKQASPPVHMPSPPRMVLDIDNQNKNIFTKKVTRVSLMPPRPRNLPKEIVKKSSVSSSPLSSPRHPVVQRKHIAATATTNNNVNHRNNDTNDNSNNNSRNAAMTIPAALEPPPSLAPDMDHYVRRPNLESLARALGRDGVSIFKQAFLR